MHILILGGTGFISGEIARLASAAGHAVTLFNRHGDGIVGDVEDLPAHAEALRAVAADVVVHSVCNTEKHARDVVDVFGDTRVLVLGSQDCYDAFQQTNRGRETSDFPISEDDPLSAIRYYYRDLVPGMRRDYDKNLMTAELMAAWERGEAQPTVFRCPMVYGPRDRQFPHRHGAIIRRLYDRQHVFPIGATEQATIWTFGYVTNIAAAIVHAFDKPHTAGRVFNLGETRVRTKRRWADCFAAAAGREFEFRVVPDQDPDAPPVHLIMDNTRYPRETGFEDPISLDAAIKATLDWGLANPEALGPVPDYEKESRQIREWQAARKNLATSL